MYLVCLANSVGVFDKCSFNNIEEALEWSSGRGGHYTVHIGNGKHMISLSYSQELDSFAHHDGWEVHPNVDAEYVKQFI